MIRGKRSFWPKAGSPPTGIFSSKGKQKVDSTSQFAHKDVMTYAHKGPSTRSKPTSNGNASLRHQKHYGRKV